MDAKPTRILGIDPGTGIVGWGLIEKSGHLIIAKDYGCIKTSSTSPMNERLLAIFQGICAIIKEQKPSEVAVEDLFFFKNQKTIITVAEARGVILLASTECGLPVFEYTPLQVKQALTGYGRAEKKQMQTMVQLTCKLAECPKPDDAADALAVAICHAQTCQRMLASK